MAEEIDVSEVCAGGVVKCKGSDNILLGSRSTDGNMYVDRPSDLLIHCVTMFVVCTAECSAQRKSWQAFSLDSMERLDCSNCLLYNEDVLLTFGREK